MLVKRIVKLVYTGLLSWILPTLRSSIYLIEINGINAISIWHANCYLEGGEKGKNGLKASRE
jgi:hypothetical protein